MPISGNVTINVGLPNESAGSDGLYTAFNKINDNFNLLFANANPNIVAGNNITITTNPGNIIISSTGGSGGATGATGPTGATGATGATGFIWVTAPLANNSAGTAGQTAYDSGGNFYVCVATNTWSKFIGNISW